jgi:hypothetical protein
MSRAKHHRKIMSGKKIVRRELDKQRILFEIKISALSKEVSRNSNNAKVMVFKNKIISMVKNDSP